MQTNVVKCLFHRDDIFERKAAGCVEVVQSNGRSVSLSLGAVSDCRREGRLPPLSLRSPETQRGRAAPHGVGAREGGTAPFSGGLQGCSSGASSGPGTGPGRSLPRQNTKTLPRRCWRHSAFYLQHQRESPARRRLSAHRRSPGRRRGVRERSIFAAG